MAIEYCIPLGHPGLPAGEQTDERRRTNRKQDLLGGAHLEYRARICNRLWSPGIDSEKSIPPAYLARRAGTKNRVVVLARQGGNRFLGPSIGLQIRAQVIYNQ